MKCGFIGLGNIGLPLALKLLPTASQLIVYDVNAEREKIAVDAGAEKAAGLRGLFENSEVVFASLPSPKICEEIAFGAGGLLDCGVERQVYIEMSTVSPAYLRKLGERAERKNIHIMDSGVAKGTTYEGEANTCLIVGGEIEIFNSVSSLLDAIADEVVYVGRLGSGMTVKLINNLMSLVNLVTSCEGIALGFQAGVSPSLMIDIIGKNSGDSYQLRTRGRRLLKRGDFNWGGLSLELAIKDCELIRELGTDAGIPLYMLNMANTLYEHAKCKGFGGKDRAAVITIFEELIGREIV